MTLATNVVRQAGWLTLAAAVTLTAVAPGTSSACDQNKKSKTTSTASVASSSMRVSQAAATAKPAVVATTPAECTAKEAASCCAMGSSKSAVARRAPAPKRVKRLAPASRVATAPAANVASAPAAPAPEASKTPGTAGIVIAIDPETGAIGQPTPEQFRELAAQSKLETPTTSLSGRPELIALPDGGTLARLNGKFMKFSTIRIDANGKKHFDCAGDPNAPVTTAPTAASPRSEVK